LGFFFKENLLPGTFKNRQTGFKITNEDGEDKDAHQPERAHEHHLGGELAVLQQILLTEARLAQRGQICLSKEVRLIQTCHTWS